jgi:outer membrane protein OmpA-like peptidoglycan-associated protein
MELHPRLLASCFLICTAACAGKRDATPTSLEDKDSVVHSTHDDSFVNSDFPTTATLSDDPTPQGPEIPDQRTVYTSQEVFVDPTLSAACGWEKPTLYFKVDSADTGFIGDVKIDLLATCLNNETLGDKRLNITGYADPSGTDSRNRELGLERANAVAAELTKHNVDGARITTYSRGESTAKEDGEVYGLDRKVVVTLDQ